jgi:heme/copper-type cytochrome/quinol oxidase subunit 2
MKSSRKFLKTIFAAAALATFAPSPLFACAACYGRSDSPLAHGINWGIFTLMCVIVTVLASIATFFVYIVRKEAAALKNSTPQPQPEI